MASSLCNKMLDIRGTVLIKLIQVFSLSGLTFLSSCRLKNFVDPSVHSSVGIRYWQLILPNSSFLYALIKFFFYFYFFIVYVCVSLFAPVCPWAPLFECVRVECCDYFYFSTFFFQFTLNSKPFLSFSSFLSVVAISLPLLLFFNIPVFSWVWKIIFNFFTCLCKINYLINHNA